MKAVVTQADKLEPQLSRGWLDYAQHVGFVTDTARVRTPTDKPRVERTIHFVQHNFWAGENFTGLLEAQDAARVWCAGRAGLRIHGTTAAAPAVVFATDEAPRLLPIPAAYDVPIFKHVKVGRDFHASVGRAVYSLPETWIGSTLDVRFDSATVKFYHRGQLIKQHPRQPVGGHSTDVADYPPDRAAYAQRNITPQIESCDRYGPNIGIYAARLVDDPRPWSRMRAVYALIGLVRRYGPGPVDDACATALELDVVSVPKIGSMLARGTEKTSPALPAAVGQQRTRFSRDPSEYSTTTHPFRIVTDDVTDTDTDDSED